MPFIVRQIAAGGTNDGEPGLRHYSKAGVYAAFVRDLDGHRLEALAVVRDSQEHLT